MVALTVQSKSKWYAPLPLWAKPSPIGLQKKPYPEIDIPTIFRFDNDSFMEEFTNVVASAPLTIADWVAQYETWREPMASPRPVARQAEQNRVEFLYKKTKQRSLGNDDHDSPDKQRKLKAVSEHDKQLAQREQDSKETLKLYQPAQQRFYIIGASLVCDTSGFPDSSIDRIKGEKVSYVVRRLLPDNSDNEDIDTWDEYAFVEGEQGWTWQQLAPHAGQSAQILLPGEEQYPLFPLIYRDHCNKERKILGGVIPVGKRETWLGAPAQGNQQAAALTMEETSPLERLLVNDVIAPWKNLILHANTMGGGLSRGTKIVNNKLVSEFPDVTGDRDPKPDDTKRLYIEPRDQIQTISWYILLDFAKFLEKYLPEFWQAVLNNDRGNLTLQAEKELFDILGSVSLRYALRRAINGEKPTIKRTMSSMNLRTALVRIRPMEEQLEEVDSAYDRQVEVDPLWPNFLFALADPVVRALNIPAQLAVTAKDLSEVEILQAQVDNLLDYLRPLLDTEILAGAGDVIGHTPVVDKKEAYFVIRCIYEKPLCGPLFPPMVSKASLRFHVASFFDPDAPSRPIRIPMPMDISPAGLRKYQKNTGFIISDMLCGKIKQIRKLTLADLVLSVLPWPFHKSLPKTSGTGPCKGPDGSFGMICSLSIPIVTLCALILLMIIVALFDIFFKWLPLLFVCLPIPGLKGKK